MKTPVRTYHELTGEDRSQLGAQVGAQRERVKQRLSGVAHVVAVMSGKGGVGKSFVTAGLAATLARRGRAVGVLDADLHAPTAARMLGATGPLRVDEDGVSPVIAAEGVRVMSSDLLLDENAPLSWKEPEHEGFIWHGTLEAGMLREFLGDVAWGPLDLLLVDMPPGTERLGALIEFVPDLSGVVAVTIPSDASRRAVARALETAKAKQVRVLGIVENMASYGCPSCGAALPLFRGEAGAALATSSGAPVLASLPFDPESRIDAGSFAGTGRMAEALRDLADALLAQIEAA